MGEPATRHFARDRNNLYNTRAGGSPLSGGCDVSPKRKDQGTPRPAVGERGSKLSMEKEKQSRASDGLQHNIHGSLKTKDALGLPEIDLRVRCGGRN